MKNHSFRQALLGIVATLVLASQAHASWTFSSSKTTASGQDATGFVANTSTISGDSTGDTTLTSVTGTYTANGANNAGLASGAAWVTGTAATPIYYNNFGLGMASDGNAVPNHAIDNNGTNTEAILLGFQSSVALQSIGLGWTNGDADVSLFRYTGTTAPTIGGTGATLTAMTTAGWELVGNYADLMVDTTAPFNAVNSKNLCSSWWLISAYNTGYGTTSANGGALNQGDDYFKLYAVAGTTCVNGVCNPNNPQPPVNPPVVNNNKTPEPASLALVSLGLLGVFGARNRRQSLVNEAPAAA